MLNIAELKLQHDRIFVFPIGGLEIPVRALTVREYSVYSQVQNLPFIEREKLQNHLFREIVLDPIIIDEMMKLPAGIVSSVCGATIYLCGITLRGPDDYNRFNFHLAEARQRVGTDPMLQICAYICSVFPGYKVSDLKELDFYTLIQLGVMAENIGGGGEPVLDVRPVSQSGGSLTDQLFEDARKAETFDHPGPANMPLPGRPGPGEQPMDPKRMRDMQVIQRVQEMRQQQASANHR